MLHFQVFSTVVHNRYAQSYVQVARNRSVRADDRVRWSAEGCYSDRLKVCQCVGDVMSLDVIRTRATDDIQTVSKQLVFEGAHRDFILPIGL